MDTLDQLGHPRDGRVLVLNRSDSKVGLRTEDVVSAIKAPIAVMIPSSSHVPASVNRGVPIVLDEPKHPISVALRGIAEQYILHDSGPSMSALLDSDGSLVAAGRSSKQPKAHRGLFRRSAS